MNQSEASWPARLRSQSLPTRLGFLGLVVLLLFPVVASIAWSQRGGAGVAAAAIAGVICWAGASIALTLAGLSFVGSPTTSPSNPQAGVNPMAGMLAGMIFRMGLPLAAGALLHFRVPALRDGGILLSITGFYLATLPIETWLSLPIVEKRNPASATGSNLTATNMAQSRAS